MNCPEYMKIKSINKDTVVYDCFNCDELCNRTGSPFKKVVNIKNIEK